LTLHSDCGAYNGLLGGFLGDQRADAENHHRELRRAAANLRKAIPKIAVAPTLWTSKEYGRRN